MLRRLELMNLELTTACPLRCPQCYCSLEGGEHLDKDAALHWIEEAARVGIQSVCLSGGETLCYPYLFDLIKRINELGMRSNVSLSGCGFDQNVLDKLVEAGNSAIYVSLNGSTEEINCRSRQGYEYAVSALELLQKNAYTQTYINWVLHDSNADDFPNIIKLAEKYDVFGIYILGLKPTAKNEILTLPTHTQFCSVGNTIKSYCGKIQLVVEPCYSQLRAYIFDKDGWVSGNIGKNKGCRAGVYSISVNVDGTLSPCRHLVIKERFDTIDDYLNGSKVIGKINGLELNEREPCSSCVLQRNCRHCLAINNNINKALYFGNQFCEYANI